MDCRSLGVSNYEAVPGDVMFIEITTGIVCGVLKLIPRYIDILNRLVAGRHLQ